MKNISLKDAMDKVRLWESAREQATQMVNPSQDVSVDTNVVGTKRGSGKICFNCGNEGHFGRLTGIVQLTGEDVRNVENMVILLVGAREKKVGLNLQNTTSSSKGSIQHSIMIAGKTVEVDDKPILSNKTWCT